MFSSFSYEKSRNKLCWQYYEGKTQMERNGSSKSLSPERKIALAPNRVSFSDTPPLDVLVRMGIGLFCCELESWMDYWFLGDSAVLCVKVLVLCTF